MTVLVISILAISTPRTGAEAGTARWSWPVDGARGVVAGFIAPAHAYGAGHRGIDVQTVAPGTIRSPADGVVAFRGVVVDRPLITIDHGDGLVTTLEPVESALRPGDRVSEGDEIGSLSVGGHAPPGTLHLGLRVDGVYVDPMLMFASVERAVLLPCCDPI